MYPVARRLTRVSGHFGPREPIPLGGGRFSPAFHGGVDFTPLERGARIPAYAVGAGSIYGVNLGSGAAGLNVMLRLDSDGSLWWYGHLSRVDVRAGQRVRDGQQLGLIGATGNTTGVHLHLERHWPRVDVETDPWPYIKDARDVDGNTSSWQTGNPPVASGDAGVSIQEDSMRAIQATNRGIALVGPGYFRPIPEAFLGTATAVWGQPVGMNDRQFDEARALATQGVVADALSVLPAAVGGVLEAVRSQASKQGVALDEGELAKALLEQGIAQEVVDALVSRAGA